MDPEHAAAAQLAAAGAGPNGVYGDATNLYAIVDRDK
jgi:hypothetical protein